MRKWLALILPLLLLFPFSAQAQTNPTLDSFKISLWAEYDQPSMLVIYDFTLPANTPLPASVKIRIPKNGNITAVAYEQDTGYVNSDFSGPVDENNQQVITVPIKQQVTYHVEYYEPYKRDGNNRSYKLQWSSEYAVNDLRIEVRLPTDSTSIKSTPTLPFAPNQDSLIGSADIGSLSAGATYQMDLNYARNSEETSVQASSSQATASEPITKNTAGRVTLNNLPYILGGIGLLLIFGAIYYFWRSNSLAEETSRPRKRARKMHDDSGIQIYCHECGTRASTEDRFCRVCGTKLRNG